MKKLYMLTTAAAIALMAANPALAQRKNTTSHDVAKVETSAETPMHKMKKDMGKHHQKKMQENTREINEDYQKALHKIDKSSFSDEQKTLLKKQAAENKDLALKQSQERAQQAEKHMKARKALNMQDAMHDKANRKAVKEIHEIAD